MLAEGSFRGSGDRGAEPTRPPFTTADLSFTQGEPIIPQIFRRIVSQESLWAPPNTRISRRSHEALLFALEAIRIGDGKKYKALSADLEEESARMSDLFSGDQPGGSSGNGRAQNGGSRAARGAPVPTGGVRTPTEVMRARRERDARKKAQEEEAARLRNLEQEELRRIQEAEAAAALSGETPVRRRSTRRPGVEIPDASRRTSGGQFSSRRQENIAPVAGVTSRPRTSTLDQGQPRPVSQQPRTSSRFDRQQSEEATAGPSRTNRVDLPTINDENPTNPAMPSQPAQTQPPTDPQTGRTTFPNAFERWETLSSHWEGLTSYWIRRLQENSNELNREPLNQQMSRQIVDLSAAGSNLFLAVFELQRLRASSDRKFQRWFFETRSELERYQANEAELERLLRVEREERARVVTSTGSAEAEKLKAEELVKEMRRELQISKEEARRAWEELGRREQEERDRTVSLRSGEPTLVGGVQVVPMTQGVPSRQTTAATGRPQTRDGPYAGGPSAGMMGGRAPTSASHTTLESPDEEERQFSYQPPPATSPTDTDPFTEEAARTAPRQPPTRTRESARSPMEELQFYQRPTQPVTSSAAIAALRATQPQTYPTIPTSGEARGGYGSAHQATTATSNGAGTSRFYPQAVTSPALQAPFSAAASAPSSITAPPRPGTHNTDLSSHGERSYIASTASGAGSSIGDEEYEIDADGNYRLDSEGQRILWRDPTDPASGRRYGPVSEEGSEDEYDVQSDIEREREYARRYGAGALRQTQEAQQQQPQYSTSATLHGPAAGATIPQPTLTRPTVSNPSYTQPLQSLQQAPELSPASAAAVAADYSGQGYGPGPGPAGNGNDSGGWGSSYTPRHHHRTPLSDIIEQEDERSRRTSPNPSRASYIGSEPGSAGAGISQQQQQGGGGGSAREMRERFGGGLSGR